MYIPISYLHKQIFWTATEAIITGKIEQSVGPASEGLVLVDFTDTQGLTHHIRVDADNTFIEGKDSAHIQILYNPFHPTDYVLVNPGRYMVILFLPLGLLACYFGWPEQRQE